MQRQRQVVLNPRNNGLPCPSHLVETIGCNREPCSDKDVNCKITEWAMWSTCSSTCGPGFQERKRAINKRLSHCGQGCVGNMTMVQPCFVEECGDCENCVWGLWKEWSDCDRHCGGGQRHRLRNITQWPTPGCSPCEPKDKVWVEPCNVEVCSDEELCVDGLWGNWGDWETCSMSCEGGNHWRTRNILRAATSCGNQPTGDSKEAGECNQGVPCKASQDCMWSEWVAWSDCSSSCHGIKQRTRTIETHGFGDGKYCEGPTEETFPCAFGISNDLVNFQSPALLMNLKNVVANNLGGSGPYFQDHPSIRYKGVASDGSSSIDLLITAADGYNPGQGARLNGASGEFGNIFLPRDSTANLEFQLVDSATNDPVFVNDLTLKFFDMDEGNDGSDLFTYEVSVNQKCQEYYIAHESVFKVVGTCDTPEPTIFKKPIVAELECRDGGFEFLKLDKVGHNNLGGKGPDFGEEVLLYNDVLSLDGRSVDLVIEVEDGQQYEPGHLAARVNGKIGGATRFNLAAAMGVIDQLAGTSTRFNAHFQYQNGEAATVPKLNLTWFDIDQPRANLRERVLVNGYRKFFTVDQAGHESGGNSVAFMEKPGGGEFSSTRLQVPEPIDPGRLTSDQADVAVTTFFEKVHQFTFELEVSWIGPVENRDDHAEGQLFYFAGSACAGDLPPGVRRLQIFNIPWGAGPAAEPPAPPPYQYVPIAQPVRHDIPHPEHGTVYGAPSVQQRSIPVRPGDSICPEATKPDTGSYGPTSSFPRQEKRSFAVRFEGVSKASFTVKTGKGCGHNFLFAAKVCITGHCDPCGAGSTCAFKSWEQWSPCSERCEGGQQTRSRQVTQGMLSSHGGGCDGALSWVKSCNTQSCAEKSACKALDCKWEAWNPWGACSKCGGQKFRNRKILQLPFCGGRACKAGDAEEIQKCPRFCHGQPQFCVWSDWSPFTECSVTCGCGKKSRNRELTLSDVPADGLMKQYEEVDRLKTLVEAAETKRTMSLAVCFVAGPTLLLAFVAVLRVRGRSAANRPGERRPAAQPLVAEEESALVA